MPFILFIYYIPVSLHTVTELKSPFHRMEASVVSLQHNTTPAQWKCGFNKG